MGNNWLTGTLDSVSGFVNSTVNNAGNIFESITEQIAAGKIALMNLKNPPQQTPTTPPGAQAASAQKFQQLTLYAAFGGLALIAGYLIFKKVK